MPDASQFTLGLFDSTTIGWTIDTPKAEPVLVEQDDDENDAPDAPAEDVARDLGQNLYLDSDRALARGWPARARDNIAAIRLSKELETTRRPPTRDEQEALLRFVGFGATELAQNAFPLPGATEFRPGWETIGQDLADAVTPAEYAALQRATQYAHYTPEPIIRGLWRAAQRLGFAGGHVLEPGMGTGLFFALLPEALRSTSRLTGIEYDPVTARIARHVHPRARIRCEDYTRSPLGGGFDLAIGNPPFADRIVRADPTTAALNLRLHDYFIARSIARLRPGGLAIFVTSTGTMDKADSTARAHIAGIADLIGAVRLPECSMRATAGTDVVIDVLVFQRRAEDQAPNGIAWRDLAEMAIASDSAGDETDAAAVDAATDEPCRPGISAAAWCRSTPTSPRAPRWCWAGSRSGAASTARACPPPSCPTRKPGRSRHSWTRPLPGCPATSSRRQQSRRRRDRRRAAGPPRHRRGERRRQGGQLLHRRAGVLMQIVEGRSVPVAIREGKEGSGGITPKAAKIIRALLPIRDAVREVLRAQASDRPWREHQLKLRVAYSTFIRFFGPINHTVITTTTDPKTGEERETHRRPNLAPFADDPDCWLVASIEDYDLDSGLARMGPMFRERVVAPPAAPVITSAADALAVTLNQVGRVDPDHLAELLERDPDDALAELGTAVFRNPRTEQWETADAYLSGAVRSKLATAKKRRRSIHSISATSRRCSRCSPRICAHPISPPGSARRGSRPMWWRRSPDR